MKRAVFVMMFGAAVAAQSCFADAPGVAMAPQSVDDQAKSLVGFNSSLSNLETANADLSQLNRRLQQRIEQWRTVLQPLVKEHQLLEEQSRSLAANALKKTADVTALENRMTELKARQQTIEKEIMTKQSAIAERLASERVIWSQLSGASAEVGVGQRNRPGRNLQDILSKKVLLEGRLKVLKDHLADLQSELKYQALLADDPQVSLPQLTIQRDQLKKELSLKEANFTVHEEEIKQLKAEIQELSKTKTDQANLLQILEVQYDKNQKFIKDAGEEKKLQETIVSLRKDGEVLKQQAADLQIEMINLDKSKAELEKTVPPIKKPLD
jgi:DNA repair exonuclease SbcCD ATPase subunit